MQKKRRGEGSFHRINACMYILVEQSSEKEDKNVDRGGGAFYLQQTRVLYIYSSIYTGAKNIYSLYRTSRYIISM